MTTPTPAPVPAPPAQPHGLVAWVEEHFVPGLKAALADAEKAREVIPAVQAVLSRFVALEPLIAKAEPELAAALGPLLDEAQQILAVIAAL